MTELDDRYDPEARMPWSHAAGPGYHTRIAPGTRVHQTREAADYVLELLAAGRDGRAHEVLQALLELQVTDPVAAHYGLWGWYLEEPPETMNPADWNWADFIGVRLAQALAVHSGRIEPALRERTRDALRHAAMAIFRRNVGADYTNIAVMGAVASAAAGEILGDGPLLDYARRRLAAVIALRVRVGGFTEYNSPWYHKIVLEELDRADLIVADGRFRDNVRELRELTWESLAERYHPGTGQFAGPISRAYHDRVPVGFLGAIPEALRARFEALPVSPLRLRTRFSDTVIGTTWMVDDACLGSAGEEFGWTQRRPLLGYWRTTEEPAVVLRARMLLDGHDLSAAWCRQAQVDGRVLSAWWLSYDSGDFHPALDKPEGSVFHLSDLRLVVSVRGRGVRAARLGEDVYALAAGDWKAVVHTTPAMLAGETAVAWSVSHHDDEARVEAILYRGPRRAIDFHHARLRAAFAVELVEAAQNPAAARLHVSDVDDGIQWRWDGLEVTVPANPTPFSRT